jgi:cell wall-associated NlpC family hydrolase
LWDEKTNMILRGVLSKSFSCLFFSGFFILAAPAAAWGDTPHIVKKGESLSAIARKYGVAISAIQGANDLEDTRLQIGQSLIIPKSSPEGSNPSSPRKGALPNASRGEDIPETHVVKSGDTLSAIAKRYCLAVQELQELNELKGTRLQIGQVLQLKPEDEVFQGTEIQSGEGSYEAALALNAGSAIPISQGADVIEEGDLNPLVTVAESFLGMKYRRGGTNVKTGLDCSAYVQKVFRMVGMDLPRTAREQFGVGLEVARDALRLGDLVFFKRSQAKRPAHVGIYIGNDQFIHSSTTKRKIRVDSLNTRYFSTRFIGGRRMQEMKEPQNGSHPEMDYSRISLLAFEPAMSVPLLSAAPQPIPSYHPDL